MNKVIHNGNVFEVKGPFIDGHTPLPSFHQVILRHGPDKDSRFSPARAAFADYSAHYQKLLAVDPALSEPPVLHVQTFNFFDGLIAERISEPGERANHSGAAARRSKTLLLSWEPSHQQVVQQGAKCLLEVVRALDELEERWTILVTTSPIEINAYRSIIERSIRASNDKLQWEFTGSHSASWQAAKIAPQGPPYFLSPFPIRPMPLRDDLLDALDGLLLRILNRQVEDVVSRNHCDQIGPVHPSVATALLPTWNTWRLSLELDNVLRADFLRLLCQVELDGANRWDGSHSCLPNLVSALVLMLATHEGEQLAPIKRSHGNIAFGGTGIGLGSGCATVDGQLIADVNEPHRWSVDALFLSQAHEKMFQSDELLTDGGVAPASFSRAKRVAPAIIQNTRSWRTLLGKDLSDWITAVQQEFARWRKRQQDSLDHV